MIYAQADIDNGTVVKMGNKYFLSEDIYKVFLSRMEEVAMNLE